MRALPLLGLVFLVVPSACSSKEAATPVTADTTDTGAADTTTPTVDTGVADTGTVVADAPPDVNFPDPFTACTKDPGPGMVPTPMSDGGDDPTGGADKFTLAMALQGFTATTGTLKAAITTEKGVIVCSLDEAAAPISVANFVGLARGTRPVLAAGAWTVKRFYDGLKWHRVIPNFVIQGGDPKGTGSGGPGYDLPVENHVKEPLGTLAMAGSSPTSPSGSQFYIVVGTGPAADYNVFGKCENLDIANEIADVETNSKQAPLVPIRMLKIDIARCP